MNLASLAHVTSHAIDGLMRALLEVSACALLLRHVLRHTGIRTARRGSDTSFGSVRWRSQLRFASLCAGGPPFVTAVIAAAYNTVNPGLSQAAAIASACIGICATTIPCVL